MTNAKSTLAVTAVILGGLLAASPFPYPREPEARPRRVVQAVAPDLAEPAATVAWTDPPARGESRAIVETAAATVPDLQAPIAAAPAPAAESKPAEAADAKLVSKSAEQAKERAKELAKRRRLAQAARARQAARKPAAAADGDREVASAAPAGAPFDPVTSLLKGLGFGRQG